MRAVGHGARAVGLRAALAALGTMLAGRAAASGRALPAVEGARKPPGVARPAHRRARSAAAGSGVTAIARLAGTRWWLEPAVLAAVVAMALFLRFWDLDHVGFRGDEAVYAGQAAVLADIHPMERYFILLSRGNSNLLLYQHIVSLVYRVLGLNDLAARIVSATFSSLTIVVTLLIGRTLYDRPTACLAALLMAISSYAVSLGRLAFLDSTLTFFFALALLCLAWFERSGSPLSISGFAAAASFAVQAKLVGVLLFLIAGAYLLLSGSARRLSWRHLAAAAAVFLVCLIPAFLQLSQNLQQFLDLLPQSSRRISYVPWYYYARMLAGYEGPVLPCLWAGGIVLAVATRSRKDLLPLVWIAVVLGFFQLYPLKAFNYMLPLLPALTLLGARALVRLAQASALRAAAAAVALAAVGGFAVPSLQAVLVNDTFGGLKEAAQWLSENTPGNAGVMTMSGGSAQYVFSFYGHRDAYPYGRFQLATVLPGGAVVPPTPTQHETPRDWVTYWPPKLIESGTVTYLVYYTNEAGAPDAADEPAAEGPIDRTARQRMFKKLIERYHGELVHTVYRDHRARVWIYRITNPLPRPVLTYSVQGGVATVTGWGFAPNSPVTVSYGHQPVLAETRSGPDTSASVSFPLPPWTRPRLRVTVSDGVGDYNSFIGLPRAQINVAARGGVLSVTGAGMTPNSKVALIYHHQHLGEGKVDANGSMSLSSPLPAWAHPRFHLVVVGEGGGIYGTFNGLPRPDIGYSVRGGVVTVHGSNIAPGTVLTVSYGGRQVAFVRAADDGTFTATFVPRALHPRHRLVVAGQQGTYASISNVH